jgi:uncharacterized protein
MLTAILICIVAGICTGFLSGFFGIGGGFVLVPLLVKLIPYTATETHDNIMYIATATSLASIILASSFAVYLHAKKKNLHFKELFKYAGWVIAGTIIAKFVIQYINALTLKILFICFLYLIVIRFIIKVIMHKRGEPHNERVNPWFRALVGLFTGAFSIFVGVGGGVPTTFLYSHYKSLRFSIGMGAGATIFVSLSSTIQSIIYALTTNRAASLEDFGGIDVVLALCLLPTLVLTIPLGINAMHKVSPKVLNIIYLLFMIALSTFSTISFFA